MAETKSKRRRRRPAAPPTRHVTLRLPRTQLDAIDAEARRRLLPTARWFLEAAEAWLYLSEKGAADGMSPMELLARMRENYACRAVTPRRGCPVGGDCKVADCPEHGWLPGR